MSGPPGGPLSTLHLGAGAPDLTTCDQEPIHIPGTVQPHGALIALRAGRIVVASDSVAPHFGLGVADLLGRDLGAVFDPETRHAVETALAREAVEHNPLFLLSAAVHGHGPFDVIAHAHDGLQILEFEPSAGRPQVEPAALIRGALGALNATRSVGDFAAVLAREVRHLTGFDRVMVYQFAPDGTGSVIAEQLAPGMEAFLGLRYPASDIPQQARALYVLNMIRIISDVHAVPSPLSALPEHPQPLDLSYAGLRAVSPIHIEYLKNMGVGASMSISIVRGQELWGLIACHHDSPRVLPYDVRGACEFLGQVASVQLSARQERDEQAYELRLRAAESDLVDRLVRQPDPLEALGAEDGTLLSFINAPGAAIHYGGETLLLGLTPTRAQVAELCAWLATQPEAQVVHTDALGREFPAARVYADTASGMLAVPLTQSRQDYVLWFRPELLRAVTWGGDPNKPVQVDASGTGRLSPRQSFAAWQETVRGHAAPWQPAELQAARALRRAISAVALRRAEETRELNVELQRSNAELDAFAYIASHDLKEPLRGLHNYSVFLLETYEHQIDEDGAAKLRTLVRLTQRMDALLDSLLLYSRVGRVELHVQPTPLAVPVADALDVLASRLRDSGATVTVHDLPTLRIDRMRVTEIYQNLISNALKYTTQAEPHIEVGVLDPAEHAAHRVPPEVRPDAHILYVRDDGIGIREQHFETIFRIFKRLHGRDQYGGGAGAGLTIVRKIAERHGGLVWVESGTGQGSTFLFTLEA
ncbi:light-regulated signal transduction histidine kinase (bacteriophytochrome) [Deinococcus metalli]|uniref:histidine kinase n=1 Tax=Deinococcus metalli TaxID=1141878 RepID=A0A7W8KFI3_9DEIO|nr:ATP-binding protein [Deinococcus metalli]MBB5377244.1 light-regulated signal transduction histidine kinase (bacteriophytochrome) [Deinococcus metalli]GHF47923.1 histidine kinase [Deinococcus metalli]